MEIFIPIGALLIGWFLNEISQYFRRKKEDKKGLARAITELLDIRHQMLARHIIAPKIGEKLGLPQNVSRLFGEQIVKIFLGDFLNIEELSKRYNEAVNTISYVDPILSFRLRSKELMQSLIEKVDKVEENAASNQQISQQDHDKISEMKTEFMKQGLEVLDNTLIELAWLHSWKTWRGVKKLVKRNEDKVLETLLSDLIQKLNLQKTENEIISN
jgi:hypothetical protein